MNKVSSNCDRYSIYLLVLYIVCNQTHHLCVVWCFAERNIFLAHYRALTHSLTPHMLFSPRVVSHRPSGPTESIPQIVPERNPRVCLEKSRYRYNLSSKLATYYKIFLSSEQWAVIRKKAFWRTLLKHGKAIFAGQCTVCIKG